MIEINKIMCFSSRKSAEIKDIRWKRIINLIFKQMPANVLDIGCSAGNISSFLVENRIKIFGVDIVFNKLCEASSKGDHCCYVRYIKGLAV